jgi:hypothetical protein
MGMISRNLGVSPFPTSYQCGQELDLSFGYGRFEKAEILPVETELEQVKYLKNLIEREHRFIKFQTALICAYAQILVGSLFHTRTLLFLYQEKYHLHL